MAKYMTVGQFRESLTGISDNVVIAVACENRCEPHPVYGGHFVPHNRLVRQCDEVIIVVELWQNENLDLQPPINWNEDE
jgi:hypothetical protein